MQEFLDLYKIFILYVYLFVYKENNNKIIEYQNVRSYSSKLKIYCF